MKNNMKNNLVIIAGARRGIGKDFFDYFASNPLINETIGISHSGQKGFLNVNLYDKNATYKAVQNINLKGVDDIFYMHAIGIDKFEPYNLIHIDEDGDGIDDEVYASNVIAFKNFAEPFLDRIYKKKIPTRICNIGSLSDIYNVPFWSSFTKSKNQIRKFVKSIHEDYITGIMLDVGSTLNQEGNVFGRVNADTTYWQTSEELLQKALPLINYAKENNSRFVSEDFFKRNPNFEDDYFTEKGRVALFKQWQKDLGFEGKEIPLGIRI